ncbi:MAG: hypothetical protein ACTSXD_11640 [Candidatus Heimdallarchaeaceae archaeon]
MKRECEICKEVFDIEELDFIRLDGGESWLVCRNCEEEIKEAGK